MRSGPCGHGAVGEGVAAAMGPSRVRAHACCGGTGRGGDGDGRTGRHGRSRVLNKRRSNRCSGRWSGCYCLTRSRLSAWAQAVEPKVQGGIRGCVVSGGRLLAVSFVVSASLLSSSGPIGGLAGPDVIEGLPIASARDATAPDSQVDFNGDGYADLALTADDSYDDDGRGSGAVQVLYGSPSGLRLAASQYWAAHDFPGVTRSFSVSSFGHALASGDFDGDGFSDLAIGDSGADVGPVLRTGTVRIVYGSKRGLTVSRSQLLWPGTQGLLGSAHEDGAFGRSLVAANFGNGAQDDLAVGASSDVVHVIYGSRTGLAGPHNQIWSPETPGVLGSGTEDFGASLAAGNFGKSQHADLAIGAPGADVVSHRGRFFMGGAVHVLYGTASGLSAKGNQLWTQDSKGIAGKVGEADEFGASLAAAPFAGRRYDDLAIGAPNNGASGFKGGSGSVNVLYGSKQGLSRKGNQLWSQKSKGIDGKQKEGERFGQALAADNFGRDRHGRAYADLAVGVPSDAVGRKEEAGSVNLIFGGSGGLSARQSRRVTEDSPGIRGTAGEFGWFGTALAAGNFGNNFNGGHYADLAIRVEQNVIGDEMATTSVSVIYGSRAGLSPARDQVWTAESFGRPFVVLPTNFGLALLSG